MWAAEKGYNEIVSLLIGAGVDLFARNDKGERALSIAGKNNHQDTAKLIEKAEFRYRLKRFIIFGALPAICIILVVITGKYAAKKMRMVR